MQKVNQKKVDASYIYTKKTTFRKYSNLRDKKIISNHERFNSQEKYNHSKFQTKIDKSTGTVTKI